MLNDLLSDYDLAPCEHSPNHHPMYRHTLYTSPAMILQVTSPDTDVVVPLQYTFSIYKINEQIHVVYR